MKASQSKTVSATVKLFRLGILLILALMLITACGKEGSSDEPKATPTAATESTGTPTPTAATPSPTAEPTNEPTTEPTAAPTAEPTSEVSATPTVSPIVKSVAYGDLTDYLGQPASALSDKFGSYRYEYWTNDYYTGTTGGLNYDNYVQFAFSDSEAALDTNCRVNLISVAGKTTDLDLGNGLRSGMTLAELKRAMGSALYGPFRSIENEDYSAYGFFRGLRYCFLWNDDPAAGDAPADIIMITESGLSWFPNAVLTAAVRTYSAENAALLDTHKAQYRNELRDICREAPVQKFGSLATVSLDGDFAVELYEIAGFGYNSAWKGSEANPEHAGVDRTKEMYTYGIAGRLFESGKLIAETGLRSYSSGEREQDDISTTVSWIPADDAFTNAVCKMAGLTPASSDCLLRTVTTETWVNSSLAIHANACYIGDSTTPAFTGRKFTIKGNDGGFFGEHIYLADGSELPDFSELTTIATGEGFLSREVAEWPFDGRKVSWTLAKTASGVQIVGLRTDDFDGSNGSYAVAFYIYIDGCLFEYSGEFIL